MKEIETNQCNFCSKTSVNKNSVRVYEEDCFLRPATRSCGTCMWYSLKYVDGPHKCYLGESFESTNEFETIPRTKCCKCFNSKVVEDMEIFDNELGILEHIFAGDTEVFEIIASIKLDGSSYYNGRTRLINE